MQVAETVELSAVVWREEGIYVALCAELDVASQGKSVEEALVNLQGSAKQLNKAEIGRFERYDD